MNNLGTAFLYGNSSGNDLNFQIKTYASKDALLAATPSENTFGIVTTKKIPGWSFSATQPDLAYKDVNILKGIGTVPGGLSSSGTISSQNSTNKEVTVNSYLPVKYGMTYKWTYYLSVSKSMWFAISEYTGSKGSYKHKARTIPVNAVNGTFKTGTYTPSASEVTAIKVSWRTFGNSACAVTFIEKNVPYKASITDGHVWVKVSGSNTESFNSLKKNKLEVYPTGVKLYSGGSWSNCTNYFYQNHSWGNLWDGELYDNGNQYSSFTGGWICRIRGVNGGVLSPYLHGYTDGGPVTISTLSPINLTNFSTLHFTGHGWQNSSAGNDPAYCMINTSQINPGSWTNPSGTAKLSFSGNETSKTYSLNINNLSGSYYIGFYAVQNENLLHITKVWME